MGFDRLMAQTPVVWADAIGIVSDEYKNAVIDILDSSLVTSTYDAETDTYIQTGNATIASGIAARVQPFRAQVNVAPGAIRNPSGDVRVRIQIPRTSVSGRIKRGWQILVTTAERNPELSGYALNVDAVVNSSWRASITMECSINVETETQWGSPLQITGSVLSGIVPVANATVRAFAQEDGLWISKVVTTSDADGSYFLRGTMTGVQYTIAATATGFDGQAYNSVEPIDLDLATLVAHNATGIDFDLTATP